MTRQLPPVNSAEDLRRVSSVCHTIAEIEGLRRVVVAAARIARRTLPSLAPGGRLAWAASLIEADEVVPQYVKEAYQSNVLIPSTTPAPDWHTPGDIYAVWTGWSAQDRLREGERGSAWYTERAVESFIHHVARAQAEAAGWGVGLGANDQRLRAHERRLRAKAEASAAPRRRRSAASRG